MFRFVGSGCSEGRGSCAIDRLRRPRKAIRSARPTAHEGPEIGRQRSQGELVDYAVAFIIPGERSE